MEFVAFIAEPCALKRSAAPELGLERRERRVLLVAMDASLSSAEAIMADAKAMLPDATSAKDALVGYDAPKTQMSGGPGTPPRLLGPL